jgi:hypothetical protein
MSATKEDLLISNLKSRISFKIEAGKQFLIVVVGLGLTSAVAEKLKYSVAGLLNVSWSSDGGGAREGYFVSEAGDPAFTLINLATLGVFLFYAIRFFFHNYLYMCEAYEEGKLRKCTVDQLRILSSNASLDLMLNLFTGVVICLVSMALSPHRLFWLLALIVVHFFVDFIVFAITLSRREGEKGYRPLHKRVFWWLGNNIVLAIIFCVTAYEIYDKGCIDGAGEQCDHAFQERFLWIIGLWFANCCIAYAVTAIYPDRVEDLVSV